MIEREVMKSIDLLNQKHDRVYEKTIEIGNQNVGYYRKTQSHIEEYQKRNQRDRSDLENTCTKLINRNAYIEQFVNKLNDNTHNLCKVTLLLVEAACM